MKRTMIIIALLGLSLLSGSALQASSHEDLSFNAYMAENDINRGEKISRKSCKSKYHHHQKKCKHKWKRNTDKLERCLDKAEHKYHHCLDTCERKYHHKKDKCEHIHSKHKQQKCYKRADHWYHKCTGTRLEFLLES